MADEEVPSPVIGFFVISGLVGLYGFWMVISVSILGASYPFQDPNILELIVWWGIIVDFIVLCHLTGKVGRLAHSRLTAWRGREL